ncbi:MAG TPA: nucleoside-diphosphate kinase, partial [Patescibacteria group bacterium]|nr:nucleoside-diphosphate kinase [Patescibacteria group bacterium]
MEQTLVIVKPDAVARGLIGEIVRRFESEGLVVCGLKMVCLAQEEAEGFYQVHRHQPFFESLTRFMSSGPCVPMILEGEGAIGRVRTLMG